MNNDYNVWLASQTTLNYPDWLRLKEQSRREINEFMSDVMARAEMGAMVRTGLFTRAEATEYTHTIRLRGMNILPAIIK